MSEDEGYRATELGEHWFEKPSAEPRDAAPAEPAADEQPTVVSGPPTAVGPGPAGRPVSGPTGVPPAGGAAGPSAGGAPGTSADPPTLVSTRVAGTAETAVRTRPETAPAAGAADGTAPDTALPSPDATLPQPGTAAHPHAPHTPAPGAPAPGDAVLRFGPGVPDRLPPAVVPPGVRRRRRQRRSALVVAVVVALALGWFGWRWIGPPLEVKDLAVRTSGPGPGCGGTAEVVGTVTTNGAAGTLRYRWVRSDGTASPVQEERVARGQEEARLRLLWTFRGQGTQQAEATLELVSPAQRSGSAAFRYHCE